MFGENTCFIKEVKKDAKIKLKKVKTFKKEKIIFSRIN